MCGMLLCGMSRPLINDLVGLTWHQNSTISKMEGITILDPSRLRIPFPSRNPSRPQQWPTITPLPEEPKCEEVMLDISSVISKPKQELKRKDSVVQSEIQAWCLSLAYSVFGLSLALCNLLALQQSSGRACCGALSPLPVLCLLLQATTAPNTPTASALLLCMILLPGVCTLWSLPLLAAFIVLLALSMLAYCRKRGVLAYVCSSGAVLSLGQTVLAQDPQWGVCVSVFFLGVLCVSSCERTGVKVWI
jgi:hypothetical protein